MSVTEYLEPSASGEPLFDVIQIERTIRAASSCVDQIQKALQSFRTLHPESAASDPRVDHLQPLMVLKEDASAHIASQDRLRTVLACLSLAADFEAYEASNGWTPKRQQLVHLIQRNDIAGIRKIGSHVEHFASDHGVVDRETLRLGLSLGFKLQVLEDLLEDNLSKGAMLLFGFECAGISKLTYKNFRELQRIIEEEVSFAHMRHFCVLIGYWLDGYQQQYHDTFRRAQAPRGYRNSSTSSDRPLIQAKDSFAGSWS